jgi:anti-sigma factor RsiW
MSDRYHPPEGDLSAYLDGELPAAAQDEIAQHLAGCNECQARLSSFQYVFTALEQTPSLPLERDLSASVLAALQTAPVRNPAAQPKSSSWLRQATLLQVALALLLLAFFGPQTWATWRLGWETIVPTTLRPELAQWAQGVAQHLRSIAGSLDHLYIQARQALEPPLLNQIDTPAALALLAAAGLAWLVTNGLLFRAGQAGSLLRE